MSEFPLLSWFHRLFPRPVFPGDAKRTRLGAMVSDFFGVAILIGTLNLAVTVPLNLYVSPFTVAVTAAAVGLSLIALILVRRGWVFAVAGFGTLMLILIGLSGLYKVGTVQSLQMTAFFTAIVFSTLSFGARAGAAVTTLLTLIFLGFTVAEGQGLLIKAPNPSPWNQWILFLTHGFLIFLLSALVRRHMAEAVGEEQKLTEQVRALLADVTAARDLAEETGARYRTVVENVAESLVVVQDSRIVFGNPRLEALLQTPLAVILNQPFQRWVHPDDIDRIATLPAARDRPVGNTTRSAFRVRDAGGRDIWVEFSAAVISWQGRPATLAFVADISERKRLEESLERSLESATEARRHAEAASQFKSSFLANLSHEIRTPMNSIVGMSRLAERTVLTAQQRDYLAKIRISGDHLLSLIDNILDLSKIEVGKLELEDAEFDLGALLDQLRAMIQPRAEEKGLGFSIERPASLPSGLRGDPLRVRQVLLNLCGNALKFTSRGEIKVTAEIRPEGADRVWLRLAVSDTGIGLTPDQMARLFRSYSQADSTISRQFGGTGLGLSISKQLVELMGGNVDVSSAAGEGSCFWFVIPLEVTATATGAEEEQSNLPKEPPRLDGIHILLADDNSFNRQVAVEFLAGEGVRVTAVADGAEAVSKALRTNFDAILMDVQMPVLDGLDATRQIRAAESGLRVPILAMTANATKDDRRRCLDAGMDDFLTKPIEPERLFAVLRRYCGRQGDTADTVEIDSCEESMPVGGSGEPIDRAVLDRLAGQRPDKAAAFVRRFHETLRQARNEADLAFTNGDLPTLAAIAHRVKSGARWIGAGAIAAEFEALQTAAASGDSVESARRLAEIAVLAAAIDRQVASWPVPEAD